MVSNGDCGARRGRAALVGTAALALCLAMLAMAPSAFGAAKTPVWALATGDVPLEFTWSEDSDCAGCHAIQAASLDDESCQIAGGPHALLDCMDCHAAAVSPKEQGAKEEPAGEGAKEVEGSEQPAKEEPAADPVAALAAVHKGITQKQVDKLPKYAYLKATEIPEEFCLGCHKTLDGDGALLTDSKGNAVASHDLPDIERHDAITCSDCHDMHSSQPVVQTAQASCKTCHHANVYECFTCHGE